MSDVACIGPADAGISARLTLRTDLAASVVRLLSRTLPIGREASAVAADEVIGDEPDTNSTSNSYSEQPAHRLTPS